MNRIKIGIDPAFREKGFCVCIIDEEGEVAFKVFKNGFMDFMTWCDSLPDNCLICVENSNLQNTLFDKSGTKGVVGRKGMNVGMNRAASQYTVDYCQKVFGKNVKEVSPLKKGEKWLDDKKVRMIAKAKGHDLGKKRLNQDKRDSYKLALMA